MDPSFKAHMVISCREHCLGQGMLPYVAVAEGGRSIFPGGFAREGIVVLNFSDDAVRDVRLEGTSISFSTRFNGVVHEIVLLAEDIVWTGAPSEDCVLNFGLPSRVLEDVAEDGVGIVAEGAQAEKAKDRAVGQPDLKLL